MTNEALESRPLRDIVTENFRTAEVFERHGLDFCCQGKQTLGEACAERGIDAASITRELHDLGGRRGQQFAEWSPGLLVEYIIQHHHTYVREKIPVLAAHTEKIASVHGERHPELIRIADIFKQVASEMQFHMLKEERMLFPYIKALAAARGGRGNLERPPFGTIRNPIAMMESEHEAAGSGVGEIRLLSGDFTIPDDACATFRVTYQELREFEQDLHQHVHLENNILFPRSIALEDQVFEQAPSTFSREAHP